MMDIASPKIAQLVEDAKTELKRLGPFRSVLIDLALAGARRVPQRLLAFRPIRAQASLMAASRQE